ncbi:LLM class flavin-dependent oxidoreductase [Cohnella abietis]|nr:LLM class flavin-dependent oxidoreductase [Cohnella abietis]
MNLGAFFLIPGHHLGGWRHPEASAEKVLSFDFMKELAQTAERGKFDMIFIGDELKGAGNSEIGRHLARYTSFEPTTLLSALSTVTEKIGLAATLSTTFNEPFHVARKLASIDHLSGGRVGWNVVTSSMSAEAHNFGQGNLMLHEERYLRAAEFMEVVKGLWDTYEDDALVIDKKTGIFSDADKIQPLDYQGKWFSVKGPLNIARPPQGYPVMIQAGTSEAGRELAARSAEAVFAACHTFEEAREYYSDMKGRLAKYGRSPEEFKIMPGVYPIVGRTEEEANEKEALMNELVLPKLGVAFLSGLTGIDLSGYSIDDPFPGIFPDSSNNNGIKSRIEVMKGISGRENLTIRQFYEKIAGARGHWSIKGSPSQIADQLEYWFREGAADGFNVMPPYLPGGLNDFVDLVIPELQQRGLFRTEYTGRTLREHLGLSRPENQRVQAVSRVTE